MTNTSQLVTCLDRIGRALPLAAFTLSPALYGHRGGCTERLFMRRVGFAVLALVGTLVSVLSIVP